MRNVDKTGLDFFGEMAYSGFSEDAASMYLALKSYLEKSFSDAEKTHTVPIEDIGLFETVRMALLRNPNHEKCDPRYKALHSEAVGWVQRTLSDHFIDTNSEWTKYLDDTWFDTVSASENDDEASVK
jgi:hypothetical protein